MRCVQKADEDCPAESSSTTTSPNTVQANTATTKGTFRHAGTRLQIPNESTAIPDTGNAATSLFINLNLTLLIWINLI